MRWYVLCFSIVALVVKSTSVFSQTLYLSPDITSQTTLNHQQYLIDYSSAMTLEDALASQLWQPQNKSNLGFIKKPVWTYITLHNPTTQTLNLVLYNPRASLDHLKVWVIRSHTDTQSWLIGDVYAPKQHPIIHRYSAIPLQMNPNEQLTLVSQIISSGPIETAWKIETTRFFSFKNILLTSLWGLLFGVILILVITHLSLYFSLRSPWLLVFLIMVILSGFSQALLNGFVRNISFEQAPVWLSQSIWIVQILSFIFLAWFAILFFNTKKTMPKLHLGLVALIALETALLLFHGYGLLFDANMLRIHLWTQGLVFMAILIPFFVAFSAIQNKLTGAGYYLIDQLILLCGNLTLLLTLQGHLELTPFTELLPAIALVGHLIFLTLAISQRINSMHTAQQAQSRLLLQQAPLSSIGQSFGNITHQAKLPLTRIGSQLTLLQGLNQLDPLPIERMQAQLPKMHEQITLLQHTVEDFKNFYDAPLQLKQIELSAICRQVTDLLSGKLILATAKVEFISRPKDLKVTIEANALAHVLMVLLDNSLDMLIERKIENTLVTIGYQFKHNQVELWIEDRAGGVKIKPIERVFDNFISEKQHKSTGIGLSIAKLLVEERLKGRISVQNTSKGAKFNVYFKDLEQSDAV